MKKLIAIVAFVAAMCVAGNAQAQLSLRFGYAPETFSYNNSTDNYNGFFVGVHNNFDLKNGLNLTAGVQGRMNIKNEQITFLGVTTKYNDQQLLVEVPIALSYGIALGNNLKISPFIGPMVSFALSGKSKTTIGSTVDSTLDWYGNNSNLSRLNLSVMGGVNVKYVRLNLFCGYQMGLLDLNKSDNVSLKTNGFFVGLGYDL